MPSGVRAAGPALAAGVGSPEAGEGKELYEAFAEVRESVEQFRQAGEYGKALKAIARLRRPVDRFFDKVLVMTEDAALRANRLRLLGKLDELFSGVAHFAEITSAPQNVGASTKVKVTSEK